MFKDLIKFFNSLKNSEKSNLFIVFLFFLISGLLDFGGLFFIYPFVSIIIGADFKFQEEIYEFLNFFGFYNEFQIILIIGIIIILLFTLSVVINIISIWYSTLIASRFSLNIGTTILKKFLNKNFQSQSELSSSDLNHKIIIESSRAGNQILIPMINIISSLITSFIIIIGLALVIDYKIVFVLIFFFSSVYLIIFLFLRSFFYNNSIAITSTQNSRIKLISNMKKNSLYLKLYGGNNYFLSKFDRYTNKLAKAISMSQTFSRAPRYLIELLLILIIITYGIYYYNSQSMLDTQNQLPSVSLLAASFFKLLPLFQRSYSMFSRIKGNLSSYSSIKYYL